jgi:hypothetical protein
MSTSTSSPTTTTTTTTTATMATAADNCDDEEIESNLIARYEQQHFEYYDEDIAVCSVTIKSATSTVGSNLTDEHRDRTGIMIWPATHLLCQWLTSTSNYPGSDGVILELGCGCGLVGVVAACKRATLAATSGDDSSLWVSTDMDEKALELARQNLEWNNISEEKSWVRNLRWGEAEQIKSLQDDLEKARQTRYFADIMAADIVYPSTANQILKLLFSTVEALLIQGGTFHLSFCTRDGHRTPSRLIEEASNAAFSIDVLPPISDDIKRKLPPLLDAKMLVLKRDKDARAKNEMLGGVNCRAFPGLNAAIQRAAEESSDEEWEAPAFFDGDDDEDDEEFRRQLVASKYPE